MDNYVVFDYVVFDYVIVALRDMLYYYLDNNITQNI